MNICIVSAKSKNSCYFKYLVRRWLKKTWIFKDPLKLNSIQQELSIFLFETSTIMQKISIISFPTLTFALIQSRRKNFLLTSSTKANGEVWETPKKKAFREYDCWQSKHMNINIWKIVNTTNEMRKKAKESRKIISFLYPLQCFLQRLIKRRVDMWLEILAHNIYHNFPRVYPKEKKLFSSKVKGKRRKEKINIWGSNNMMLMALSCSINDTTKRHKTSKISSLKLMCVHAFTLKPFWRRNECFPPLITVIKKIRKEFH